MPIEDNSDEVFIETIVSETKNISPHIGLRKVYGKYNRWYLEIVLDDDTGIEEINNNWWKITAERDGLIHTQGHNIPGYFRELITLLQEEQYTNSFFWKKAMETTDNEEGDELKFVVGPKRKPTYRELAMDVNFDLLVFLLGATKKDIPDQYSKLGDFMFRGLLRAFGKKDDDIDMIFDTSQKSLKNNECPWDIRYSPIDKEKIRSKLRYVIERDEEYGFEVIGPAYVSTNPIFLMFRISGIWDHAVELLRSISLSYQSYKNRLFIREYQLQEWLRDPSNFV
jgi:hypothetical protein